MEVLPGLGNVGPADWAQICAASNKTRHHRSGFAIARFIGFPPFPERQVSPYRTVFQSKRILLAFDEDRAITQEAILAGHRLVWDVAIAIGRNYVRGEYACHDSA